MKIKTKLSEKTLQRSRNLRKNATPQEIIFWSRIKNRIAHYPPPTAATVHKVIPVY